MNEVSRWIRYKNYGPERDSEAPDLFIYGGQPDSALAVLDQNGGEDIVQLIDPDDRAALQRYLDLQKDVGVELLCDAFARKVAERLGLSVRAAYCTIPKGLLDINPGKYSDGLSSLWAAAPYIDTQRITARYELAEMAEGAKVLFEFHSHPWVSIDPQLTPEPGALDDYVQQFIGSHFDKGGRVFSRLRTHRSGPSADRLTDVYLEDWVFDHLYAYSRFSSTNPPLASDDLTVELICRANDGIRVDFNVAHLLGREGRFSRKALRQQVEPQMVTNQRIKRDSSSGHLFTLAHRLSCAVESYFKGLD